MKGLLQQFCRDTRGNVLMIAGLMFLIMVGVGGASIDLGRQQLVRIKLQQASDAAALAGALAPDGADRSAVARRYFDVNFPATYMGVARPRPVVAAGTQVTVSATANVPTYFVQHLGIAGLQSRGNSQVDVQESTRSQSYDLILVMDNSGSMDLRDVGASNSLEASVTRRAWARVQCTVLYGFYAGTYCPPTYLGTAGASRVNALRFAGDTIARGLLQDNNATRPNRVAAVTWTDALRASQNFTSDYATMSNFLLDMYAYGGTNSTTGMQQAQTLSGNLREGYVHAVVLISDGANNSTAYNSSTINICNTMKNRGTLVYTIAFGQDVANDATVRTFMSNCASIAPDGSRYYFSAPDAATLSNAFRSILGSLKKVRIVQ